MKLKVTLEFETETQNGDIEKSWYVENCHDVEQAIILQMMHGTPYIFNWDAIVKRKYDEFNNRLKDYEIY